MQNETAPAALASTPAHGPLVRWRGHLHNRLDRVILACCQTLIGRSASGHLHLTMPSGASAVIGGGTDGADLTLKSYGVFWNGLRRGTIGFAESMIAGTCESRDLAGLVRYFIDNKATLHKAGRGYFRVRTKDRAFHAARANTHGGSRENIAAHYDIGNAFYRLWLDASMGYSSGIYAHPGVSLKAAQQAKIARIIEAMDIHAGHRVLEIGCGWGAFAAAVNARGAHVTGLTLSREQFDACVEMLRSGDREARIDIRIEDYRDTTGTYDRIASIEMIEAVGEENWPRYFATLHDRLVPGGIAVLQAITIDDAIFETYRCKADFIQRYIFPGGVLPTQRLIEQHAVAAGLRFERVETFGASYALTLIEWRQRFHASWPQIQALGFDDRFRRMWDYYLAYCQAGFERGTIDVGIYRLRKADIGSRTMATRE